MSLLDTVRKALLSISNRQHPGDPPVSVPDTVADAYSVVDEALLDPILRIAAEQYAVRRDQEKIQEILRSPERIAAFVEREKEILVRLGASREWCDAFFRDLGLVEKFPAELLEAYAPDHLYRDLDKLRLPLGLMRSRDGQAAEEAAGVTVAPTTQIFNLAQALRGAAHVTLGVALIAGNSSALAALLFTAPILAPATKISFGISGYAFSRAYVRLTEAIGL
jgi:hypothetical protein